MRVIPAALLLHYVSQTAGRCWRSQPICRNAPVIGKTDLQSRGRTGLPRRYLQERFLAVSGG